MDEGLKIMRFAATNIKGIRVVEITPEGDVVTISGANGAGKSTVLDSIERTLCGGQLALSKGTDKGSVELDMGEYSVQRVITQKTDRLVVKNKDGAQYPSPRTFLEKFVGPLSIDPLSFVKLKDREQMDVLFRLCPDLRAGLEKANTEIERVKAERSDVFKDVTRLKVEIEKAPCHEEVPGEPVDTAELTKELRAAQEDNEKIEQRKRELVVMEIRKKEKAGAMADARVEAGELRAKLAELEQTIKDLDEALQLSQIEYEETAGEIAAAHPVDTAPIYARLSEAGEINAKIRENQQYEALAAQKTAKSEEYSRLGETLKDAEMAKAALLSSAPMPIPGLSVNEKTVTYNDIPISELSTSEKVRVGAALAVAQNPKAKVILVDDVSLLDSKNLTVLHETLAGFQIWQVVNDETGKQGIFIEEGTTKAKGEKS